MNYNFFGDNMEIKSYKKDAFYSYTLGAFPTIELLTHKKEYALKILIHSSFKNQEVLDKIISLKGDAEVVFNDKLIAKLSSKDNCYIIGIFKKYTSTLDPNSHHLLLDNPSNMGNLGTILRSSLGFNIKNIAIIKPGVDIFDPKVLRSAMGAFFAVNICYFSSLDDYKNQFKKHVLYSFMLQATQTLQETKFDKSLCTLAFGNEATGLDLSYLSRNSIFIKHEHSIDSLNLPTAVGIALYEFNRQKK